MRLGTPRFTHRRSYGSLAAIVLIAGTLGACSSSSSLFSESAMGVAASPRVMSRGDIPTGGGYEHVGRPYVVAGQVYVPREDPNYSEVGMASWYGPNFHGRLTANGEIYDMYALTAAHTTLPLPSYVRVTNLENGASLVVRVNDRGPFHDNRIIDLSAGAADLLGIIQVGTARVQVDYIGRASLDGNDNRMLLATYQAPNEDNVRVAYDPNTRTLSTQNGGGGLLGFGLFNRVANNAAAAVYQPTALGAGQDPVGALLGGAQTYAPLPTLTPAQVAAEQIAEGTFGNADEAIFIQVGVFAVQENAADIALALADYGTVTVSQLDSLTGRLWSVSIATTAAMERATIDAAVAAGAAGAYAIH